MNAHINRDLPVALVTACRELGRDLRESSPEHADFEGVNRLLAHVEAQIKSSYLSGWPARLDQLVHRIDRIDDVVAMWDVPNEHATPPGRTGRPCGRFKTSRRSPPSS